MRRGGSPVPRHGVRAVRARARGSRRHRARRAIAPRRRRVRPARSGDRAHARAPAMIDEQVVREREQEGLELRARLVALARADQAAPGFLEQVVGELAIARVAQQIAVQRALVTRIERFEGRASRRATTPASAPQSHRPPPSTALYAAQAGADVAAAAPGECIARRPRTACSGTVSIPVERSRRPDRFN